MDLVRLVGREILSVVEGMSKVFEGEIDVLGVRTFFWTWFMLLGQDFVYKPKGSCPPGAS
jgi:hypothetical protein